MNLDDMIKKHKNGNLYIMEAEDLINDLIDYIESVESIKTKEVTPLWKRVLNQTEFYNGHGQLTLSEIALDEAMQLCEDLSDHTDSIYNIFYLKLFKEFDEEEYLTGSIYQSEGDKEILWVSFERILK